MTNVDTEHIGMFANVKPQARPVEEISLTRPASKNGDSSNNSPASNQRGKDNPTVVSDTSFIYVLKDIDVIVEQNYEDAAQLK